MLGELHHAIATGVMAADAEITELGQIIAGERHGRRSASDITIADLTGTGVQDTAIATLARDRAQAANAGHDFRKLIPAARPNKRGPRTMQPNLKFSRGEYADRLAKTRKAMEAKGVDLLDRQRSVQHGLADRL